MEWRADDDSAALDDGAQDAVALPVGSSQVEGAGPGLADLGVSERLGGIPAMDRTAGIHVIGKAGQVERGGGIGDVKGIDTGVRQADPEATVVRVVKADLDGGGDVLGK